MCLLFLDALEFGGGDGPMYAVQFNPVYSHYIASVTGKKPPCLWDIRQISGYLINHLAYAKS